MLENRNTPLVLLVGGVDSAGMAGLSADQRFVEAAGAHACTAVTALTLQTADRFLGLEATPTGQLREAIESTLQTLPIRAVKIGMLANAAQIAAVGDLAQARRDIPWVLDPVRGASHGKALLGRRGHAALCDRLIPHVDVLTPNLPEAAWLTGIDEAELRSPRPVLDSLRALGAGAVLLKGGHALGDPVIDWLGQDAGAPIELAHARQAGRFRGTGCALASALTALLARGEALAPACRAAVDLVQAAMRHAVEIEPGMPRCLRPQEPALRRPLKW